MNKAILTFLLSVSWVGGLLAQQPLGVTHSGQTTGQSPFPVTDYIELPNPTATDVDSWKGVTRTTCAWGDTYHRYKKESHPHLTTRSIQMTGWRGERVAAQLVISSPVDMEQVSVEITPLVHRDGKQTISNDHLLKGFVRYVMTDELNKDRSGTCGARSDLSLYDSTLVADPIDHLAKSLSMKAYTSQAYWIRVWIPQKAATGRYTSTVTVRNKQQVVGMLKLNVNVQSRVLPEPSQWAFHLDLWQNPFAVARYHQVPVWSEAHFELLKKEMKPYVDAGGKVITASIMHYPWSAQTYDPFETMITWIKRIDGTWLFDYTVFDRWVQFMMDMGVNKAIGCYSMIPWKLSFQYFDQATNSLKELKTKPGEDAYYQLWLTMLKDFAVHLKSKGWFDITHIAMDERQMSDMKVAFQIIKEADPRFKVSLAGALHEEFSSELNDYSVAIADKYNEEMKKQRRAEGKVTTFYTCCTESWPNTYTFSQPAEGAWMGWYAAKENLDGYLRWALNSWTIEPLLDSRFYTWGAGDTYLLYPGGRTCLRYENLVEGIQAFEKVRILKEELKAQGRTSALRKLEKVLQLFDEVQLAKTPADVFVKKAKRVIDTL
ncbi:hypothetical protein, secreted [gut metagenome]|uniref:Uncharacterized protein n=1 Tax=gut metagenome TaxID=749906 RepID=J9CEJ8_9ZZZZ